MIPLMTDRTDGYVTDIAYTLGYYAELNPLRARLAFLDAGLEPATIETACELGFGQGVSMALHAAASPTRWYGTDLLPVHVDFARGLSAAAGADIALHADTFEEFACRSDLPTFDFVGLHGVWSWISDRNRAAIVSFLERKLRPGGIVYISYNTLPGWAAYSPIRHLLVEHANRAGADMQKTAGRIDEAIAFFNRLLAAKPAYARGIPGIADWFKDLREADRAYLAHEYFNRDWTPMYFAEVERRLAPAGLAYACSADFTDHIAALDLSDTQKSLLRGIRDPGLRESTRDFIVNQQFRQDYWVREPRPLSPEARAHALRAERVVSVAPAPELPFKLRAALALNKSGPGEAVCNAVLATLADRRPRTLGEIERAVAPQGFDLERLFDAVMVIASCSYIAAAQDDAAIGRARARTERLNAHLIEGAGNDGSVRHLASPVTGGGIRVGREEQLFLRALRQGESRPDVWAREAARVVPTEGDAAALAAKARTFDIEMLPMLRALQIV